MKICMVSFDFLPNPGGVASHVFEISRALVKEGHSVCVIAATYDPQSRREELGGFTVYRVPVPRIRKVRAAIFATRAAGLLRKLSRSKEFDVIHWHNILPDSLVTKIGKAKARIFTNHTSGFLQIYDRGRWGFVYRWLLDHADAMIAPSKELAEKSTFLTRRPVFYIPNGVDPERFSPSLQGADKIRSRYGIGRQDLIVLCPRRFVPKNGVVYLAEALPLILQVVRNVVVIFAGGGFPSEQQKVKEIVRRNEADPHAIFTGTIPNSEMPAFYQAADVVVLPSLMEATSLAGLEAKASGCPIVGTTVGGIPEIVSDGVDGILVPPRDPKALASAIVKLSKDGTLRAEMGRVARNEALKRFTWSIIAKRTVQVYEAVLGDRRDARER